MKMEITEDVIVADTPFLNFVARHYRDKLGNNKVWHFVTRPNARKAVVIVAVVKESGQPNKLVVTKEFRLPLSDFEYGMPAGLVDGIENKSDVAIRELKEETGLDVKFILGSSPFVYNSAGMTDEACAMVFVEATGKVSDEGNEASEDITTMLLSPIEVYDMLKDPSKKIGAKAWLIMNRFATTGEII